MDEEEIKKSLKKKNSSLKKRLASLHRKELDWCTKKKKKKFEITQSGLKTDKKREREKPIVFYGWQKKF